MKYLLLPILFCIFIYGNARTLVIATDASQAPVASAKCVFFNEKNDSIEHTYSSGNGVVKFNNLDCRYMEVQADGYDKKYVDLSSIKTDTIYLNPIKMLNEVVVLPDNVKELGNKTTYRIPMSDMNRYTNFYQALNEIPSLTILSSGGAYYEGDSDVVFLLNGVETSVSELRTISKEDISKIDVYKNPPARFAAQGIKTVIDIRSKSHLTGGNVGLNIDQAFDPVKGDNSAAIYYNYKRSRLSLLYSGSNSHYDQLVQNEILDYTYDNQEYKKTKKGIGSDADADNNNLSLSYQNNNPDDYLYNIKLGAGFDRDRMNLAQDAIADDNQMAAVNYLNTKYAKYNISNYFEKYFGDKGDKGNLIANVNYQHYDTRYVSSYKEVSELNSEDAVNNYSAYKTRIDGLFAEVQYEFPYCKIGRFSLSAYETYKHSRYTDAVFPFFQTTNSTGGNVTWFFFKSRIRWYVKLGMSASHIATTGLSKNYNVIIPDPLLMMTWQPRKSFYLKEFLS